MVGHRQLAVGTFDLDLGGRAGDTEHLVVVAFAVVGQKSKESFLLDKKWVVVSE
jgi:hypothetical protein